MSKEKEILLSNIDACKQRIEKLTYSLNKNRDLFPLTIKSVTYLSDEQDESIDALILRYSQIVRPVRLEFHYSHISKVTVIPAWMPESSAMDGNL